MVFQEQLEFQVKKGRRVHRVLQGLPVRGVPMVLEVEEVQEVPLENQERRGLQDMTVLQGPQEREAHKDLRVVQESRDPKDPMDLAERTACRVIRASGGSRVSKEKQVLQDPQVLLGHRVIQERLDRWEREDTRALQDLLESKAYLDPLGKKVQRVTLEVRVHQERAVHRV